MGGGHNVHHCSEIKIQHQVMWCCRLLALLALGWPQFWDREQNGSFTHSVVLRMLDGQIGLFFPCSPLRWVSGLPSGAETDYRFNSPGFGTVRVSDSCLLHRKCHMIAFLGLWHLLFRGIIYVIKYWCSPVELGLFISNEIEILKKYLRKTFPHCSSRNILG